MSGTIGDAAREMRSSYDLAVVRVPTHRKVRRRDGGITLYRTAADKWRAVAERAIAVAAGGRSVLVGTRTVAASEALSGVLESIGAEHQLLNARQDKSEADIVAQAGHPGRITIATAMAGRGTDIKLHADVRQSGGLHVILTEFHESRRIDRQLYGRAGRQGDPGSCESIVALDDDIFRDYAPGLTVALGALAAPFRHRPPSAIARILRATAQSRAEAAGRFARRQTTRSARDTAKMLTFSQRAE